MSNKGMLLKLDKFPSKDVQSNIQESGGDGGGSWKLLTTAIQVLHVQQYVVVNMGQPSHPPRPKSLTRVYVILPRVYVLFLHLT